MKTYTILRVDGPPGDPYPNNFKCWVTVKDNETGKTLRRRGYGRFIGNYSPIWITIAGVTKQLTQWERD